MVFDFDGIKSYLLNQLASFSNWTSTLYFSTYQRILDVIAYTMEKMTYVADFLYGESNWRNATLRGSLVTMSDYLAYIPFRKKGAYGEVQVIADPTWEALYPYQYSGSNVSIPRWTAITSEDNTLNVYVLEDTIYYTGQVSSLDVSVKQGIVKEFIYTSLGSINEEFYIYSDSIDNDEIEVYVVDSSNNILETVTIDEDIRLTDDLVNYHCQIKNAVDYQSVYFVFGDGVSQKQLQPNVRILVKYAETLGVDSEIGSTGIMVKFKDILYDATSSPATLYVTNDEVISDGSDMESIEQIRINAPLIFQAGDRCGSLADWQAVIESISYIETANIWSTTGSEYVNVSALTTSGDNLTDAQKIEIETDILEDRKSPTEFVLWTDVQKIYILFDIIGKIENQTSTFISQDLKTLLSDTYGYDVVEFTQSIYESNYIRIIDENQYILHHETDVRYLELGFTSSTANYQIPNLKDLAEADSINEDVIKLTSNSIEVWIKRKVEDEWQTPVQIGKSSGVTISATTVGQSESVKSGEILSSAHVAAITGTVSNLTVKPNSLVLKDMGSTLLASETGQVGNVGYLSGTSLDSTFTNQINYQTGVYSLKFSFTPSGNITLDYTQYKPFTVSGSINYTDGIVTFSVTELLNDSIAGYTIYGVPNPDDADADGYVLGLAYRTEDELGNQDKSIRLIDNNCITDIDEDFIFTTLSY